MRYLILLLLPVVALAQFTSGTTKQIDEIKNNTGTDILLNPTDKVDVEYFAGEKALQSTADGELEESAITNTELGYLSGVTSSIQTQLDNKEATLPNTTDGDLLYYNSGQAALGIGTSGQLLRVSALGFPEWADVISVSVTTKGDLQTYSTEPDRLAVGTDSQILSADSAEATGLKWIDLPVSSPITTEGDLSIGDNAGDPIRLPIGTVDQLLTSDGTTASWQDAPISTTLTTKGDIQTYDTANQRLAVGADKSFLVADSSEATGLKWSDSITGLISQAMFVGSLNYKEAGCNWAASSASYVDFTVDPDCTASNITGDIAQPVTRIPAVTILNPRLDGYYKIKYQGKMTAGSNDTSCLFTLSSSTSDEDQGEVTANSADIGKHAATVDGNFKFNDSADKTVRVIVRRVFGANDCIVYGRDNQESKFTVHFFPDSNSLAAVQNKELNATTANELSARIDVSTGNIINSNYDWLTCVNSGTGATSCTFNAGFTEIPACTCTASRGNFDTVVCSQQVFSTNSWAFRVSNANNPIDQDIDIQCSKQGADVNKSQVITGTFENINSSDLLVIKAENNNGLGLTANVTNIGWTTETADNYNAWDGYTFTVPRGGQYNIQGYVAHTGSLNTQMYINGLPNKFVGMASDASAVRNQLTGTFKFNAGDLITFRNNAGGATLTANGTVHWLTITESATTESIIKNLNDNNNVECETKYLSADISTDTNPISDLTYSSLVVGEKYNVCISGDALFTVGDNIGLVANHNGSPILQVTMALNPSAGASINQSYRCQKFTASSTSLTFSSVSITSGNVIRGNGSYGETLVELCKLRDNTILN